MDGVALKQAVTAWVSAPHAEKAARFVSAEAIRWLEWGVRSYQNVALGLAVLLFAVAAVRAAWVPRPVVVLMGLSGLAYLVQGTVVDSAGVLADGVDRHRGGFRPGRGVDDLAARGRASDAEYAGVSPRPMTAAGTDSPPFAEPVRKPRSVLPATVCASRPLNRPIPAGIPAISPV
jgi:hypothetical protein